MQHPHPPAFAAIHDFYVRTTMHGLASSRLAHMFSYLDDALKNDFQRMAMPVADAGYTEWVTDAAPTLSIGWEWYRPHAGSSILLGPGEIRGNIMLLDQVGYDHGPILTERLLRCWITSLLWQPAVASAIAALPPPSYQWEASRKQIPMGVLIRN